MGKSHALLAELTEADWLGRTGIMVCGETTSPQSAECVGPRPPQERHESWSGERV